METSDREVWSLKAVAELWLILSDWLLSLRYPHAKCISRHVYVIPLPFLEILWLENFRFVASTCHALLTKSGDTLG